MASNDIAKDAAAYMASQGRETMAAGEGTKFTSPSAKPASGKLMPKGGAQAGDPTAMGTKASRTNVSAAPGGERKGAAYSIKASYMKNTSPEAGTTLANAPVMPSVMKRGGFGSGIDSSY
jgi:hypothetical protein